MAKALVTGASSGIGLAIALELARAGHQVYAAGRSEKALNDLRASHANITPIQLDVTDREAAEAALEGLQIDVLVNNAGIMPPLGNFADMDMADIDSALEINLSAAIMITRMVVPQMRDREAGHILFTGSAAAHSVFPGMAVYSATKAAISGFAAGLRADLSPFGIRVTEIVPGRVETALYKDILDAETRSAMYSASKAVQPEDVARMVSAVLDLPEWATVSRFDIVPTRPTPPAKKG
ncbi:NADP-dependent 3-hydroxy acid dehydrogenase YdfG [Paracoccus isoporae]|uniref:NADP-dependent 3-hydroxy acid dehydrogenase YdfG n=1 Tax=Paracoccus isoporae TaxID=591205 RepID=A0A1G7H0Y9_9RHOB|nr:SDR family oxidoreductase [Paracoccus isoporae]SDE93819.1 NADP-dependent 3-hydroxy acid dehydrogenase YdfG [Paracoccus isoporae]